MRRSVHISTLYVYAHVFSKMSLQMSRYSSYQKVGGCRRSCCIPLSYRRSACPRGANLCAAIQTANSTLSDYHAARHTTGRHAPGMPALTLTTAATLLQHSRPPAYISPPLTELRCLVHSAATSPSSWTLLLLCFPLRAVEHALEEPFNSTSSMTLLPGALKLDRRVHMAWPCQDTASMHYCSH